MTWIKICGITNLEDALTAVEAGADALGFVFYEKSPRYIDPQTAHDIIKEVPANVEKVGIFVDRQGHKQVSIFNQARLTACQLYPFNGTSRSESSVQSYETCYWRKPRDFVCFPMHFFLEKSGGMKTLENELLHARDEIRRSRRDKSTFADDVMGGIFLDSGSAQQPGGTGVTFDWQKVSTLVNAVRDSIDVVVAGGLSPENVAECINVLHPWGVDVSSGVESSPGKKDPKKIHAFVKAVRNADKV